MDIDGTDADGCEEGPLSRSPLPPKTSLSPHSHYSPAPVKRPSATPVKQQHMRGFPSSPFAAAQGSSLSLSPADKKLRVSPGTLGAAAMRSVGASPRRAHSDPSPLKASIPRARVLLDPHLPSETRQKAQGVSRVHVCPWLQGGDATRRNYGVRDISAGSEIGVVRNSGDRVLPCMYVSLAFDA